MYTNGLKDRFGSPLLSQRDADGLYFDKNSSEILQRKLTSVEKNVEQIDSDVYSLEDSFLDFQGKQMLKNQENKQHLLNTDLHFTDGEKETFYNHIGDDTHLSTTDRNLLSDLANNGSKSYDWTPDIDLKIQFYLSDDYTIPVNGWLVVNSNTTDANEMWSFTVNDKQSFNSDQRGNLPIQILLSKNDVISTDSTVNRKCYFLPCKSEVLDYRVTKTPYDVWGNAVVEDGNGNLSVRNLYVPNASSWNTNTPQEVKNSIRRVEDEVAYDVNNNLVCNIQSSKIVYGWDMFENCTNLTTFNGDLSSLADGSGMFYGTSLTSFNGDLSNLVCGYFMFASCNSLTSFNGDLSSLVSGREMFYESSLTSFNGDLSSLVNGANMFFYNTHLASFNGDLSSLLAGNSMFVDTSLNEESIQNIADTIQDIKGLDKTDESIWQYPYSLSFNEDGSQNWNYDSIYDAYRGRLDLSYDKTNISDLTNINNSIAQIKAKGWTVYLDGTQM